VAEIDRLLQGGEVPAALTAAQRLLDQHLAADESAYPDADYDTAYSFWQLGRVLRSGGAAQDALAPLHEAKRRFRQLADAGRGVAAGMVGKTLTEIGICLMALGRLDEAGEAYQDAIERATRLGDRRAVAVAEGNLAYVRLDQKRYQEALDGLAQARATFEALGEPRQVAIVSHQIGNVYQEAEQYDVAEDAYRRSLAISVQETDLFAQAETLHQLGILYHKKGRLEESAAFLRQAVDIAVRSGDRASEGKWRGNLAGTLLDLRRYDEARQELRRAIDCDEEYGHATQPWYNWAILEDLERSTGHTDAASTARQQAIATYLASRRDGGRSHAYLIQGYAAAAQAISQNQQDELIREINEALAPDTPPWYAAPVRALQAILGGQRDPTLADDPEIPPIDAAELLLLLETLAQQESTTAGG
jgi:tetratricopeptide (TPR) repeat protein